MTVDGVVDQLASLDRTEIVASMARFGISTPNSFGVKTPDLKLSSRDVKKQV